MLSRSSTERFREMQLMSLYRLCRCIVCVAILFVHRTISRDAAHVAVSFVSLYRLCRDIVRPPNDFATCSSCRCIVCVAILFVHRTISRHAAHVAVSFVSRYCSSTERFRDMQLMSLYRLCRDIVRPPNDFATCSSCRCIVCVAISFSYPSPHLHTFRVGRVVILLMRAKCVGPRCMIILRHRYSYNRKR